MYLMTKWQEKKLDILYQKHLIEVNPINFDNSGQTELIHHFLQGRYKSIRWYVPCGIPMTAEQHNNIHSSNGKEIESEIIILNGFDWYTDLFKQKQKIAKNIKYEDVEAHILGFKDNYV